MQREADLMSSAMPLQSPKTPQLAGSKDEWDNTLPSRQT
jgi:hypothetical protein